MKANHTPWYGSFGNKIQVVLDDNEAVTKQSLYVGGSEFDPNLPGGNLYWYVLQDNTVSPNVVLLFTIGNSSDAFLLLRATDLGVAFQLANFVRDVGEDLDRGRVYLPLDELATGDRKVAFLRGEVAVGVLGVEPDLDEVALGNRLFEQLDHLRAAGVTGAGIGQPRAITIAKVAPINLLAGRIGESRRRQTPWSRKARSTPPAAKSDSAAASACIVPVTHQRVHTERRHHDKRQPSQRAASDHSMALVSPPARVTSVREEPHPNRTFHRWRR